MERQTRPWACGESLWKGAHCDMEKRTLILGAYDTAAHGWTLARCKITKGQQVQTFIQVPGRYAPIDASTYLTDGQPYYDSATLDVVLECSEGDRGHREQLINELVNYVDGRSLQIIHPDHPGSYLVGRVQAAPDYSDLAHCAVTLTAVCEPWLWDAEETTVQLTAAGTEQIANIDIHGRLAVVPTITVTGELTLSFKTYTWALSNGEYILPDLCLTPGELPGEPGAHEIRAQGSGKVVLTYREAVLAA